MPCPLHTRVHCHVVRNHYIKHHLDRYVALLTNAKYLDAIQWTTCQAAKELECLKQVHKHAHVETRLEKITPLITQWEADS
jgi:hypothetical protein